MNGLLLLIVQSGKKPKLVVYFFAKKKMLKFLTFCRKTRVRGAFGKFLAWSIISVTDVQALSCLVSF